jgi:hypothetical protein
VKQNRSNEKYKEIWHAVAKLFSYPHSGLLRCVAPVIFKLSEEPVASVFIAEEFCPEDRRSRFLRNVGTNHTTRLHIREVQIIIDVRNLNFIQT